MVWKNSGARWRSFQHACRGQPQRRRPGTLPPPLVASPSAGAVPISIMPSFLPISGRGPGLREQQGRDRTLGAGTSKRLRKHTPKLGLLGDVGTKHRGRRQLKAISSLAREQLVGRLDASREQLASVLELAAASVETTARHFP